MNHQTRRNMTNPNAFVLFLASQLLLPSSAFLPPTNHVLSRGVTTMQSTRQEETLQTETQDSPRPTPIDDGYWEIAPTLVRPNPRPLTEKLRRAMETNTHPEEPQSELGRGVFCTSDWRRAWNTYESPPEDPDLIDPDTGLAEYPVEVEGDLPYDLVGVLYRNGPGKMGVGGERVAHTLDGDGMILKISMPPPDKHGKRTVMFRSRFVETEAMVRERQANRFIYRGTFGTGPSPFFDKRPKNGLNSDPIEPSILSKVIGRALNIDLKNTANTQVISFAGKVLALFEAGLPYAIDPETLETLGEDTLGGVLKKGLPAKLGANIPKKYQPDFIGGTAHTAHPNVCPKTGNLVGWHWSQLASNNALEVTFTEWSAKDFTPIASNTFEIPGCELAPHDMAMTDNYLVLKINALKMDRTPFLLGLKGPAASLAMDGRAPVQAWVFPRPTLQKQFEPFSVEIPACFSIHFSHSYEHPETGNIVSFFSGWPPSDSKDFLGAWGGYAPDFGGIPPTYLWRMEIDPVAKKCVSLDIAPGCANACVEHILVHPNFATRPAENVYCTISNIVGDSTAPCGYCKLKVESGTRTVLTEGEANEQVEAFWFGSRYFVGEPLIVPKKGGDPENEDDAYLLGMVQDAAKQKSFVAVFDLARDLREGPVCKLWMKSGIPHGIHGCFAEEAGGPSVFC